MASTLLYQFRPSPLKTADAKPVSTAKTIERLVRVPMLDGNEGVIVLGPDQEVIVNENPTRTWQLIRVVGRNYG